jgi:hypothetical protein
MGGVTFTRDKGSDLLSKRRDRRDIQLRAEASTIQARLENAVGVNPGGPLLGRANIVYELSERVRATAHGGLGAVAKVIAATGLASEIDRSVALLKMHRPYHESDHVLNIAYNALCGGQRLDSIELRRGDRVLLDALGVASLPDPTTAGDFCRRFETATIAALQDAINCARLRVWKRQAKSFVEQTAIIDADASLISTAAQTKQGMEISYKGTWGYSALVVSLANTREPLYLGLCGANRPSHEGVVGYYDKAVALCREAGFQSLRLRGDTDFSLTGEFDRWDDDGVKFVFGYDAHANLVQRAEAADQDTYHRLVARAEKQLEAQRPKRQRERPGNVKDDIVRARKFKTIRQKAEDVVEFSYRPGNCDRDYRVVALRKNLSIERGEDVLFEEHRFFFYITNDRTMTADQVIHQARERCNQENLIGQLKSGVRALHAPVNTLCSNWAYMTMTALAWTLKAWCALLLPLHQRSVKQHSEERQRLLTMEFRTFLDAFIEIPAQIITTARQVRWRILAYNPWLTTLFRLADSL